MGLRSDLIEIFQQKGVATYGTDLFATSDADIPMGDGPYISIVMGGGPGAQYIQNQHDRAYEYPTAQVTVRGKDSIACETKAWQAFDAIARYFDGVAPQDRRMVVNGDRYLRLRMIQSQPFDIGHDETGDRTRYVFNVMAEKVPS